MSTPTGFLADSPLTKIIQDAINKILEEQHFSPRQSIAQPFAQSVTQSIAQPISPQKKKRNQKTRKQYKKKKAQA